MAAAPVPGDSLAPLDPRDAALLEQAKQLVIQRRYGDAVALLDGIEPRTTSGAIEIEFLKAQSAEMASDLQASVTHYRNILADNPKLTRVRLELARVLFRLEEDDAARHHFELVLGDDPPAAVRRKVKDFLIAIHNRRRAKLKFGFSLIPDSNINSATNSRRVTLSGVPFNLSDDARSNSGIGFSVNTNFDYTHPLRDDVDLETGFAASGVNNPGDGFDDARISGYVGGRYVFEVYDLGIAATAFRRWFGQKGYSLSLGGRADLGRRFSPTWSGRVRVGGQRVNYERQNRLDGEVYSLQVDSHHILDSISRLSLFGGSFLEDTADPSYSNIAPFAGIAYQRDFPNRITASIQPMIFLRFFDDQLDLFGKTREDVTLQLRTSLTYRTDLLFGFAPTLTYTFTHNNSNISFHDYNRHRVEFGLTHEF